MNSLIFRTVAPFLTAVMLAFSIFVLLRGHNEPGGGFIGGLIAASALAIYGMALGPDVARKALRVHPLVIAAAGLLIAILSGRMSLAYDVPFLTGLWAEFNMGRDVLTLSTPMLFDFGVYLVVVGAVASMVLGLEDNEEESP
jgi:multicomponent Na+:H+ antiporter subunit B